MRDQQTQPKKRSSLGQWICVVVVFIVGVMVLSPVVMKSSKKAPMITAAFNAKQVFMLLVEFDQDYGSFPNDETARAEPYLNGYCGEYSNDYLGQLLAGGYTTSEEIFHAKGGSSNQHRPDDDISTRAKTLEEGECGFSYIKGLGSYSHTGTPVLLSPMCGDGYKFNTEVYKGKAIALRVDGTVKLYRLDENHHVRIGKGKTLFDAGKDSVWGEKGFDPKNLYYAKYPYVYKEPLTSVQKLMIGCLILLIVIGFSVLMKRLQ
jgi:hypothetical protein